MKSILQLTIFFLFCSFCRAQNVKRIEISGKINVETENKEGITVYNKSSNKGTTTDEVGAFKIEVAENDVVAFGALQFQDFTIIIDKRIIKSRQVSVRLVEEINKLDEVIVLPYDLSGNLKVDAEAVRTYNVNMTEIYKGEEDFDDYQFSADNKTKIDNPLLDENRFINGLNFVSIIKLFVKKNNKPKTKIKQFEEKQSPLSKRYSPKFLKENFNIPTDLAEAFIEYLEAKSYDKAWLDLKNEIYLIEFLQKESQLFLMSKNQK